MNKGDKLTVSVGGIEVGQATIEEISEGKAYIMIPAMRVVAAVRTSLEPPVPVAPESETIVDGVTRVDNSTEPQAPVQAAPAPVPPVLGLET